MFDYPQNANPQDNSNLNNINQANNINLHQNTFFEKLSPSEFMTLSSDFIPSLTYSILIIIILSFRSPNQKDDDFIFILRSLLIIYISFIIKALFHSILIHKNIITISIYKTIITTLEQVLNLIYFLLIILGYFVYSKRRDNCFTDNPGMTCLMFYLLLIGSVGLAQEGLMLFIMMLCFPILVYYFSRDPNSFYSNFGIDPMIIENLPMIKAETKHKSTCVICTDEIEVGQDILVLKCRGKHFFHGECIKPWLITKMSCPTCRSIDIL